MRSLDQTFWGKFSEHVATIEGYMEGIDLPVGFNDNTGWKVSVLFASQHMVARTAPPLKSNSWMAKESKAHFTGTI